MRVRRLQTIIYIWLSVVLLFGGVCADVDRADGFFVLQETGTIEAAGAHTEQITRERNGFEVLRQSKEYGTEQIAAKEFYGRSRGGNTGIHVFSLMTLSGFVTKASGHGRLLAESMMVLLWCVAIVVHYIHMTDGEKGCDRILILS